MKHRPLPSAKYLRACFTYSPTTGNVRWKRRPRDHFATTGSWKIWNARFANTDAGTDRKQHYQVGLGGHRYCLHRIIWKIVTGKEPIATIDHKDGDALNNRWKNLRLATMLEQNWNTGRRKDNTSGYKGVSKNHGRWFAQIAIEGTQRWLGYFATAQEAAAAYQVAARKLHGGYYREI
jgi:hypothetical protein